MNDYQDTYGPKIPSLTVTIGDDPRKHRVETFRQWRTELGTPACRRLWVYLQGPRSIFVEGDWDCSECLALYPLTVDDEEEKGDDSKDYIWE